MPALIPPVVPAGSMAASEQPTLLGGDGLVLRPWQAADADVLVEAHGHPDIQRWHLRRFDDVGEAERWVDASHGSWRAEAAAQWALLATSDGRPVGRLGLYVDLAAGRGELTYWLLPEGRGRGLASAAVARGAAWALDDLGLHRLLVQHSVHNPASCRVADRAGFAAEGTVRQGLLHTDGWHDMHQHVLLAGVVRTPDR